MNQPTEEAQAPDRGIPWPVRWGLVAAFVAVLAFVAWQYISYVCDPSEGASPSDLGLPTLFVFSVTGLFLLLVPLERLGLRIKKLGMLEFEQIVATQAAEHAEDLSEIEERLNSLETNLRGVHEGLQLTEAHEGPEINDLVVQFFSKYNKWAFSPLRVRNWGAQQPGFEKLKEIDPAYLRSVLRRLVTEGVLETSVSKKGNTLYRIVQ